MIQHWKERAQDPNFAGNSMVFSLLALDILAIWALWKRNSVR